MGKIKIEKTADAVILSQLDGETLNTVSVPSKHVSHVCRLFDDSHPVGSVVTIGDDEPPAASE